MGLVAVILTLGVLWGRYGEDGAAAVDGVVGNCAVSTDSKGSVVLLCSAAAARGGKPPPPAVAAGGIGERVLMVVYLFHCAHVVQRRNGRLRSAVVFVPRSSI